MRGKETDSRRQCCSAGITPAYAGKRTLFCLAGRRNRDHPRVCGEKSMYSGVFYERYRITPAYAGKSFPAGCPRSRSRDHPRVCGEKPRRPPAAAVGIGSPPRMRGKDSIMDGLQGVHGITPAYAGKSDAACIHGAVVGDHPRVCGEKWPAALYEEMERGITPAYAGKSFSSSSSFVLYWDHPRVCGEKVLPLWLCVGSSGSPPRMRGKAGPADAGRKQLRDHPRVCGEKPRTFSRRSPKPGSPPRMRGKGRKAAPSYLDLRITPAYAGKSRNGRYCAVSGGDHPRVCGEKGVGA